MKTPNVLILAHNIPNGVVQADVIGRWEAEHTLTQGNTAAKLSG